MNLINNHLWVVYQSVTSKKVEIREAICLWNDPNFRANLDWSISRFGVIAFHFIDSEEVIVAKDVCKEYVWENFYPESPFHAFFLTKEEADAFYDRIQVKKLSKIVDSKRFTIGDTYYAVQFSFKDGYYVVHKTRITGFSNKQHYIDTSIGLIKIKSLYKNFTTAKREAKRKNKRKLEELNNEYAKYILEHKVAKPVKKLEIGESYYMINSRKAMKPIFVSSNGLSAIMDNGKYFIIHLGLENNVLYSTPPSYNDGEFKQKIRNYKEKINKFKELLKK